MVYPFKEGGNQSDSFYTDLADYSKESLIKSLILQQIAVQILAVLVIELEIHSSEPLTGGVEFTITAVKDTKVYLFVISQPKMLQHLMRAVLKQR